MRLELKKSCLAEKKKRSNLAAERSYTTFNTPLGYLNVVYDEYYIYQSYFGSQIYEQRSDPMSALIVEELQKYFSNPRHSFQLPVKPQGTAYQQRVWQALLAIPSGQTISYGDLAMRLASSARPVGQACKKNPIALFIPCHRVVGKHSPGGYMGQVEALQYKLDLLQHETQQNWSVNP